MMVIWGILVVLGALAVFIIAIYNKLIRLKHSKGLLVGYRCATQKTL